MHNSPKIWKTVNEILNKELKRNNLCINQILDKKGVIHTDPTAISNTFNNYFAEVGPSMAKDIPPAKSNCINNITSTTYSFYLSPTTKEIFYQTRNLNSRKCIGINNIPIKFIKIASVVITPILTNLYNDCISKEIFPDILKISQITPIYKKGPKNICCNYRPISLVSSFSKIFEKCLYSQFINYLNKKNLITSSQYGFRSTYSCSMAVSKISSEIIKSIDDKKITCTVFLDLAKAFDTVNHEILFKKWNCMEFVK